MIFDPKSNHNHYPIDLDAIGMPGEHDALGVEEGELVLLEKDEVMSGLAEMYGENDEVVLAVKAAFEGNVPHDKWINLYAGDTPGPNVTRACEVHDLAYDRWEAAEEDDDDILLLLAARMVLASQVTKCGLLFVRTEDLEYCPEDAKRY
tara:strand:- start:456 stop:902 length:447 start_codon:yes stop_codon:yes gene_type:complete